ncbi:hypothetical protein J2Z83_000059 [Virgibacillus natechei]|uniref:Siphovirus-type tail component RIFT-related domain-containing protein n=1 Tax=Virgibacillus natechei TaxID=1216297 RepID=A0ABS4IAL3_9BACI|nr:phage tail domain-containing protein [Virgibacillus natechei]MBP1967967.1 hypothetical protein [Virgibacillus natechei]UZD14745.1 phage tail family protein [Virgibacillus natechei]
MDLTIIKNGYEVDLSELGLDCLSFQVDSLSSEHNNENIEGKDGQVDNGTTYSSRMIHTRFLFKVDSHVDFHDKKDEVYKLFESKVELILIDERQPYKRWKVKVNSDFIIDNEESPSWKEFEVDFISFSPYAESRETMTTTRNTRVTEYYFLKNTQVNQNQQVDETGSFYVFNTGTISIDPRQYNLLIKFTGASDRLRILNRMNDTQWQYYGTTTTSDVLTFRNTYVDKNDESVFRDTNYGFIELEVGSNELQIYGATGDWEIYFEYRPLYI